jgi:hypothetical protein
VVVTPHIISMAETTQGSEIWMTGVK